MSFPGRDDKLLEQLVLAKEAGTKGMAKEFFAPTPGSGGEDAGPAATPEEPGHTLPPVAGHTLPPAAEAPPGDPSAGGGGDLTPEQLQQLLASLGGNPDEPQGV